ncbi:tyrosine-type recombinase/integrase [Kaistia soli]|uniref:tyrosine-type recombinase/integrase n=1 Tax=Kaistia soli TaxID=446684 RepID=UPI001FCD963F|nr:tyrosine-type recombinase/integrase [Kaistia soli]
MPDVTRRIAALDAWWGERKLSEVMGASCRQYAAERGKPQMARRELEDLRAAINHHRREGYCSEIVSVVLPAKAQPRQRWLTRDEAARLIWAAWRFREVQKGEPTKRRPRQHIARFILVALYTGSRAGVICGAATAPTDGHGFVDYDRGVFYRKPNGSAETKKRAPPIRIPARLLAHMRRWQDKRISNDFVIEWNGAALLTIKRALARVVKDAGVEGVSAHTFRHTAATWGMQNGADPHQLAGLLGMTREMLDRTYGHHHPDHQRQAADAITRRPGAGRITTDTDRNDGNGQEIEPNPLNQSPRVSSLFK